MFHSVHFKLRFGIFASQRTGQVQANLLQCSWPDKTNQSHQVSFLTLLFQICSSVCFVEPPSLWWPRMTCQTENLIDISPGRSGRLVHSHWSRSLETVLWLVDIMVLLHKLSYAIKTQVKAPKAPFPCRVISCLSLCLYGIRVASMHGKDLL